jgi:hypothetical protein
VAKSWSRATGPELVAGGDRWSRTADGNRRLDLDRRTLPGHVTRSRPGTPQRASWITAYLATRTYSIGLAVGIGTTEEPSFGLDAG